MYQKIGFQTKVIDNIKQSFILSDFSLTDKTSFKPKVSDLHNYVSGQSNLNPLYDFNDGKDTGLKAYRLRQLGLDLAEVEVIRNEMLQEINKGKDKLKQELSDEVYTNILSEEYSKNKQSEE